MRDANFLSLDCPLGERLNVEIRNHIERNKVDFDDFCARFCDDQRNQGIVRGDSSIYILKICVSYFNCRFLIVNYIVSFYFLLSRYSLFYGARDNSLLMTMYVLYWWLNEVIISFHFFRINFNFRISRRKSSKSTEFK